MTNPLVNHDLEVTCAETAQALEDGSATVIDVREPYEWEAGRIAGVRHIPLERLAAEAESIDPSKPVIFHCRLGVRSLMAAQAFKGGGLDATVDGRRHPGVERRGPADGAGRRHRRRPLRCRRPGQARVLVAAAILLLALLRDGRRRARHVATVDDSNAHRRVVPRQPRRRAPLRLDAGVRDVGPSRSSPRSSAGSCRHRIATSSSSVPPRSSVETAVQAWFWAGLALDPASLDPASVRLAFSVVSFWGPDC